MFSPTNHSKTRDLEIPRNCSFAESDWHILASFWHPVVYGSEVKDKPVSAKLLDVDLVLFRTRQGLTAAKDLCAHRGARLSLGWLEDDQLICPMHGLHYDAKGRCTKIPSLDPGVKIPSKICLRTYRAVERYGLIWVCLKPEPIRDMPNWAAMEDDKLFKVFLGPETWRASASRHTENFNDLAHFPWVHRRSFGAVTSEVMSPYKVNKTDYGFTFEYPYEEQGHLPDANGKVPEVRHLVYTYELTLPFSSYIREDDGTDDKRHLFDAACPVSAEKSLIFRLMAHTYAHLDKEFWIKDSEVINEEDVRVVETQNPQELPLDLSEEIHIPADRVSVKYRRALAKLGLGAPISS